MNAPKQTCSKSTLLQWLNNILKTMSHITLRIQQLGTGVAYLLLLSTMHPGILNHMKYYRKPANEYEYHTNLRLLNTLLAKLGVDKSVDVEKLAKLKMQDNLALLQWFHAYYSKQFGIGNTQTTTYDNLINNTHTSTDTIKSTHMNKNMNSNVNSNVRNQVIEQICNKRTRGQQNQGKNLIIRVPQKLNISLNDKSKKANTEQQLVTQLQTVGSASKRILEIESILHSDSIPAHQAKLQKIMQILNLKQPTKSNQCTPAKMGRISEKEEQMYIDENQDNNQPIERSENRKVTYIKCRKLQDKCNQYIKTSILRKNQETPRSEQSRQPRRPSVKLSETKQIFQYSFCPNQIKQQIQLFQNQTSAHNEHTNADSVKQNHGHSTNEKQRLELDGHETGVDNSILLQSDRKSVQSENNLLLPNDDDYKQSP